MGCDTAVILAAGLGMRMRPLTLTTPKPLLPLAGKPLLAHILDHLHAAGITRIIVNAHHLAPQIEDFLHSYQNVEIIHEALLLDTGGAIAAMLAHNKLGPAPFLVVNSDIFWLDGPTRMLPRLASAFHPDVQDATLLLARTAGAMAGPGRGDFMWPRDGTLARRGAREVAPYLYAGVQIISPALFNNAPPGAFSLNLLWDRALASGRLGAIVHDGLWFHLSAPDDLAFAGAMLEAQEVGNTT